MAPDYSEAHNNLGRLLLDQREYQAALAEFDAAVAGNSLSSKAHLNRGRALEALDRTADAIAAYRRGLALDPTNADGWIRAILLSGRSGDHERALELAEAGAAATRRRDSRILDLLAEAQLLAGRGDQARATLDEAEAIARSAGDADMLRQIEQHRGSIAEREQRP